MFQMDITMIFSKLYCIGLVAVFWQMPALIMATAFRNNRGHCSDSRIIQSPEDMQFGPKPSWAELDIRFDIAIKMSIICIKIVYINRFGNLNLFAQ